MTAYHLEWFSTSGALLGQAGGSGQRDMSAQPNVGKRQASRSISRQDVDGKRTAWLALMRAIEVSAIPCL